MTDLNKTTISRFERGENVHPSTRRALKTTFESAGVVFKPSEEAPAVTTVHLREGTRVLAPETDA